MCADTNVVIDRFLYAATQIGLNPAHCVVVEDAPAGITAAIAAGLWTLGLGSIDGVGAAQMALPSLMGVYLSELQTKLGHLETSTPNKISNGEKIVAKGTRLIQEQQLV